MSKEIIYCEGLTSITKMRENIVVDFLKRGDEKSLKEDIYLRGKLDGLSMAIDVARSTLRAAIETENG